MKATIVAILITTLSSTAFAKVQFYLRTTVDYPKLTDCIKETDGKCDVDFVARAIIQKANALYVYGDAWTTWQGQAYHAHVWRVRLSDTHFLWFFEGEPVWYKKAAFWRDRDANVDYLVPMSKVPDLPPVVGQLLSETALVNVSTDAGTLQELPPLRTVSCPQPTDAGVADCAVTVQERSYPDGSVVHFNEGYYLLRNRFGGSPLIPGEDLDGGTLGTPSTMPPSGSFTVPDSGAPTKTCYGVPLGATCP